MHKKIFSCVSIFFLVLFTRTEANSPKQTNHILNSTPVCEVLDSPVVISLERHLFRFEETKRLMEKAGFTNVTRFNAIDGFSVPDETFQSLNVQWGGLGQKGCAASHLSAWKEFFEDPNSAEYLFVCEDDMLPHSNFYELFSFYWERTPELFDIVLVGNQMGGQPSREKKYVVKSPGFCLHGYIVSKKGAKKLYDLYMKLPQNAEGLFIIDIFVVEKMKHNKIDYYCYDGRYFPDTLQKDKIFHHRDTGICFQNQTVGSSIHSKDIVYD